eukprot:11416440-Ditylum_brightwellii.AAC.2
MLEVKESNSLQVAEYVIVHKLTEEPAFVWLVKEIVKKHNRLIYKMQPRMPKKTHKFGIKVPCNLKEARAIDRETGTNFWEKAIVKEMKNVGIVCQLLEEGEKPPIGSKWIPCHMVKARWVAGGHRNDPPKHLTYSAVVSRECATGYLILALNNLDVLCVDIGRPISIPNQGNGSIPL